MTFATAVRPVSAGTGPAARVRFGRLLLAEWTKLRSVRSTIWSLLLLCVLTLVLTALYTALTVSQWDQAGAFHHAQTAADPTALIVGGGLADRLHVPARQPVTGCHRGTGISRGHSVQPGASHR